MLFVIFAILSKLSFFIKFDVCPFGMRFFRKATASLLVDRFENFHPVDLSDGFVLKRDGPARRKGSSSTHGD